MYNLWRLVALNGSKISFVAIYALLSRIFWCDLCAFVWRKIEPKIVSVEEKGQISCMTISSCISILYAIAIDRGAEIDLNLFIYAIDLFCFDL